MKGTILSITSKHSRDDSRVFHKFACSYAINYNSKFLVFDGQGSRSYRNVDIIDAGIIRGLFGKLRIVYRYLVSEKPQLVHIHDPEMMVLLPVCRALGIQSTYDAHEDLPEQIYSKIYINPRLRGVVSKTSAVMLKLFTSFSSFNIAATEHISKKRYLTGKNLVVRNYPDLNIPNRMIKKTIEPIRLLYFGGVTKERGLQTIIDLAKKYPKTIVDIFGPILDGSSIEKIPLNFNYHGQIDHQTLHEIVRENRYVGLCLLEKIPRFEKSLPIKLFEYLALGVPVICSDFQEWKLLGIDRGCHFVDPTNLPELYSEIESLLGEEYWAQISKETTCLAESFRWKNEFNNYMGNLESMEILNG